MENDRVAETIDLKSYGRFQLCVWGFLGGYMLVMNLYVWHWTPFLHEVLRLSLFTLSSHLIAKTAARQGWFQHDRTGLYLRGLSACVICGFVVTLIRQLNSQIWSEKAAHFGGFWFLMGWVSNVAILAIWISLYFVFRFQEFRRRAEMDRVELIASSKELQLSTLRNQLNPHFLFNSFNMLRALVQTDPDAARDAITHLAEMMRHSLATVTHNTISLARELEFVESYIALERLRFEERLRISSNVPDDLRSRRIPSMLLHALVENAVKYGIDQSRSGVDVSYEIWTESGRLRLRVVNDGTLGTTSRSAGTGLANIRKRLELLYGNEASIKVFEKDQKVVAEAHWPSTSYQETGI